MAKRLRLCEQLSGEKERQKTGACAHKSVCVCGGELVTYEQQVAKRLRLYAQLSGQKESGKKAARAHTSVCVGGELVTLRPYAMYV